jgi:hypothetical protein
MPRARSSPDTRPVEYGALIMEFEKAAVTSDKLLALPGHEEDKRETDDGEGSVADHQSTRQRYESW